MNKRNIFFSFLRDLTPQFIINLNPLMRDLTVVS